jgi:hypothetical protein
MDALGESMNILDTMSMVDAKLLKSVDSHVDERYRRIFTGQLDELRKSLGALIKDANSLQEDYARDDQILCSKITLLYSQLRSFVPSIISLRRVEISAPRPNDGEGLKILWDLEGAFKNLIRVEKQGREASAASAASASIAADGITLLDIYRRYSVHFPYYQPSIIENALLLIRNGLFLEALDRLSVLRDIQIENGKEMGAMGQWMTALCQGYLGDWMPYNTLCAERDSAATTKQAKSSAKRAAKEQSAREAAVAGITAAQAAEEERRIAEGRRKAAKDECGAAASSGEVVESPEATLSRKMDAATLARRDEESRAEIARQKAAARASAATAEASFPAIKAAGGPAEESHPYLGMGMATGAAAEVPYLRIDLTSLFNLKGAAKKVEDEITGNTWRISHRDLITYFTKLGCTMRQTGGSHQVVELPEVMEIVVDGQVVAVIPDEGGSGTLPNWDGDHFPHYLKHQMIALRAILATSAARTRAELADQEQAARDAGEALLAGESGTKSKPKGKKKR